MKLCGIISNANVFALCNNSYLPQGDNIALLFRIDFLENVKACHYAFKSIIKISPCSLFL